MLTTTLVLMVVSYKSLTTSFLLSTISWWLCVLVLPARVMCDVTCVMWVVVELEVAWCGELDVQLISLTASLLKRDHRAPSARIDTAQHRFQLLAWARFDVSRVTARNEVTH